ncbi:hypothetical protein ACQEVB_18610 [Pseudonocardia sp. CA-107938]|uniref:hypothetical protein n=1 Tax=Pseudonocardia sp. CA-107938 TaxID=3240021 RepID=UPI003D93ADBD
MLLLVGAVMAALAAPAYAQAAPTPSPEPSAGSVLVDLRLWILGALVLAVVLAFVVIARLSRDSSGGDD